MKMKTVCILMALFLLVMTGCSLETNVIGTWEQTITISILGAEGQTETEAVARFLFQESGTGKQEFIITDGDYPDTAQAFTWTLDGKNLTLDNGDHRTHTFSVVLDKNTLTLDSQRMDFVLNKVK